MFPSGTCQSSNGRRREIPEQAGIRISVSEAIKQITRRKRWINTEKQLDSDYSRLCPHSSPLGAFRGRDGFIRKLKIHMEQLTLSLL